MTSDVITQEYTGRLQMHGMGWEHVSILSRMLVNQFKYIRAASGVWIGRWMYSIEHSTFY